MKPPIFLAVALVFAGAAIPMQGGEVDVEPRWGVRSADFDTPHGRVTVHLPHDVAAGDTLSGTVSVAPEGDSPRKLRKNTDELVGHVVTVGGTDHEVSAGRFAWNVARDAAGTAARLVLSDRRGREVASAEIPVSRAVPAFARPEGFRLPPLAQAGRPVRVVGPFDGDLASTSVTVGGRSVELLAESTRGAVFRAPVDLEGPQEIALREGDAEVTGTCNLVSLGLSAPRTDLMRGERTTVTAQVAGLAGLPPSAFPVVFEMANRSPDVVRFEDREGQRLSDRLYPEDVGPGGTFTRRVPLAGIRVGSFVVSAFVFARVPPDPGPLEVPFPDADPITCPIGEGGQDAPKAPAPRPGYDFEKDGLRPLDQGHREAWGERWCAPTATGISLAFFAENGHPALIPDVDGEEGIGDDDVYDAIDKLGEYFHTTGDGGSFLFDWLAGLHRYLKDRGSAEKFTTKHFQHATDVEKEIEDTVKKWAGKEKDVAAKVAEAERQIAATEKEIADKTTEIEALKQRETALKAERTTAGDARKGEIEKELREVTDRQWDLDEQVAAAQARLPALRFTRSQWQTLRDLLDLWAAMKASHAFRAPATVADFTSELQAGEDVILRLALDAGSHVLVGRAFKKAAEDDGSRAVGLVDPAGGKTLDTRMRESGGKLQVHYRGEWRDVLSMLSVSPKE